MSELPGDQEREIQEEFVETRQKGLALSRDKISELLDERLSRKNVKTREGQGRTSLSYIEGWFAIKEANRIFGFDRWDRETVSNEKVDEHQYENKYGKKLWSVSYVAKVRIKVTIDSQSTIRDGTGYGSGQDASRGQAIESAAKEAETDAMKRALMTFGNPLGLALYDKYQKDVGDDQQTRPPVANPNATNKTKAAAQKAGNAAPVKKAATLPARKVVETPQQPAQNTPQRREFVKELLASGLTQHGIQTILAVCKKKDLGEIPHSTQEKILDALAEPGTIDSYNAGMNSKGQVILATPEATQVIDEMEKELNKLFEGGGEVLEENGAS